MQHSEAIVRGFTEQAESFNASPVATDANLLDRITAVAEPASQERWVEAACGPGLIARRLAPEVAAIEGYDLTPAMIELAQREAAAAGIANASFTVADATALPVADATFDGAVTRFSLHHIPVPGRLLAELARVVKPGGKVVVLDTVADEDGPARAWSQEIERLRDRTHWATLTMPGLHELSQRVGLESEDEEIVALELDFDDWLRRGGAEPADQALVEQLLEDRPPAARRFALDEKAGRRILRLELWLARLRRGD